MSFTLDPQVAEALAPIAAVPVPSSRTRLPDGRCAASTASKPPTAGLQDIRNPAERARSVAAATRSGNIGSMRQPT
jgi:hypothetical protein